MLPSDVIEVDDPSRVGEVRRRAAAAAAKEALSDEEAGNTSIVATEIVTNLVRHARGGLVQISRLSEYGCPGVEILSIDNGPGMVDPELSMRDGHSTAGTQGTGLGAIRRLARDFDLYSTPAGTVLVARIYAGPVSRIAAASSVGAVVVPYRGESVSGDTWSIRWSGNGGSLDVLLADGLGHGATAADAAAAAAAAFQKAAGDTPSATVSRLHAALRGTRGAAVAVAHLDLEARRATFAGLGNISAVVVGGAKPQYMISHNGTAGHEARRVQEFEYALPPNAVVALHSDGLRHAWSMDAYSGLLRRHPAVIAGVLYRDWHRDRDDRAVVVIRTEWNG